MIDDRLARMDGAICPRVDDAASPGEREHYIVEPRGFVPMLMPIGPAFFAVAITKGGRDPQVVEPGKVMDQ